MEPLSIEIVQAQPGFFTVFDLSPDKEVIVLEQVIAWRIETNNRPGRGELFSNCVPLTVDGDAGSNCIGVQNPDMTITVFEDSTYRSLEELCQERFPGYIVTHRQAHEGKKSDDQA